MRSRCSSSPQPLELSITPITIAAVGVSGIVLTVLSLTSLYLYDGLACMLDYLVCSHLQMVCETFPLLVGFCYWILVIKQCVLHCSFHWVHVCTVDIPLMSLPPPMPLCALCKVQGKHYCSLPVFYFYFVCFFVTPGWCFHALRAGVQAKVCTVSPVFMILTSCLSLKDLH